MKDEQDTPSYAQALTGDKANQAVVDDTGTSVRGSAEGEKGAKLVLRPRGRFTPESRPARRQTAPGATNEQPKPCQDHAPGLSTPAPVHSSHTNAPASPSPLPTSHARELVELTSTPEATQNSPSPLYNGSTSFQSVASTAQPTATSGERSTRCSTIPPGNWRDHQAARSANLTRNPLHSSELRTRDHGIRFSEQKPGVIFCRWDIRYATDPNVKLGDPYIIEGSDGRLVSKKERLFAIVDTDEERQLVEESPLYTFDDKGLAEKPESSWWQYLSVIPKGMDERDFKNQSPDNPVLRVHHGVGLNKTTIVVKYTELFKRPMDCDELRRVGEFDARSTEILGDFVDRVIPKEACTCGCYERSADGAG
ncbi:hypothetical protein M409DRAFT_18643 [Zasmidium cellare ATCC 36951]|uniref:Uncharacterized protein n=1 Tax=Zasmidium cellare ATCC 36951 TaxID=1080233 RepID=A0A6A6CWN9_ZASCE|nr:uncharacterized protein M409DRAFT_18643 [Zasmidium cellare ATCC 36951]KAF2171531.1 hypothetical protein M409DRAFT_18643 [Zasmidium cellare ATCC 36951]